MESPTYEELKQHIFLLKQDLIKFQQKKTVLNENKIKFSTSFDNLLEGCQILDYDWRYLYINDAAEKHNQRPNKELIGKKYMDMWSGIETTYVFSIIKQCLEERIPNCIENEFIFPNKSHGWFDLRIQPVPEGVFILSIDITERKLAELQVKKKNEEILQQNEEILQQNEEINIINEQLSILNVSLEEKVALRTLELSKSEGKFKRFFEEDLTGNFILDERGYVLNCNKAFIDIYGYDHKQQIIDKKITELYPDSSEFELIKTELLKNKVLKNYKTIRKRKNGELIYIDENKVATFNDKGEITEIKGYAYDITERRIAEQALKASEEKYRIKNDELQQLNIEYQAINEELHANLEEIHFLNQTLGMQNKTLDSLNATKDIFFSIISHDLRNPFTSILSSCELLQYYTISIDPAKIQKLAKNIQSSVNMVDKLLANLLKWARLQTGSLTPKIEMFNLKTIAHDACLLNNDTAIIKNIELRNNIISDVFMNCDTEMTNTVLRNLIANALKFTKAGGMVSVNSVKNGNNIEISVSDTGIGIKQESMQYLFSIEKNVSTPGTNDERGTGLGLLLCKELIEKQGGTIWVESQVGIGSTFIFTIPACSE